MKQIKIFGSREETLSNLFLNTPFLVSINTLKICLTRTPAGIFAFDYRCPHSGASLSDGFINSQNEIVCPLHGYRFSLLDGAEKSGNKCELRIYGLELKDEGLFLNIK